MMVFPVRQEECSQKGGPAFPVLSVVIPAYNVEEFIVPAIHSVLAQSFGDLEVIVVNDGSTDATEARVQRISDMRVRMICRSNGGLSAARNTGIRAVGGRYIALLDGDDVWLPGYAARHVAALDADPTLGISYNYLAYIDEQGEPTGQLLISRQACPTLKQLICRNHIGSGNAVVRRKCFEQAGLFDERLRACEDIEMWIRVLHKTNYQARLIPEVLTGYRVRSSSLTMQFEQQVRNACLAADIIREAVGISQRLWRRFVAEAYRIASRKALSSRQMVEAREFLREALRLRPLLFLTDLRAAGTLLLVTSEQVFPARLHLFAYQTARSLMRLFFRMFIGGRKRVDQR
jgi:glycosyltransferase involved in cell wall biosynthesis